MGNVALITGAGRGIGRAAAVELARRGWDVGVNYNAHPQAAEETVRAVEALGRRALPLPADVADGAAVEAAVRRLEAGLGPIGLLVNNAGVSVSGLFQDLSDGDWERLLAVNLGGMRHAIRAVLPKMLHVKRGSIVNISSIWGLRGASCEVGYACTKAAVVGLTRSLALELAPSGIRVNAVAPGCVDTGMVRSLGPETMAGLASQTPLGRLGTPEDIARAVAFLADENAAFITGQILTVDGGLTV